jgi:hypothetical protein
MLIIFTKNFTQLVARKIVVSIGQALTYESGRDAAESVPRAKSACLVQILVQMVHVIPFIFKS